MRNKCYFIKPDKCLEPNVQTPDSQDQVMTVFVWSEYCEPNCCEFELNIGSRWQNGNTLASDAKGRIQLPARAHSRMTHPSIP